MLNKVVVISYDKDGDSHLELFATRHGAAHRADELVRDWGSGLDWSTGYDEDTSLITKTNSVTGAKISIFEKEVSLEGYAE